MTLTDYSVVRQQQRPVLSCIVDFLLEPARLQYRLTTLVDTGNEDYRPIFRTNPSDNNSGAELYCGFPA